MLNVMVEGISPATNFQTIRFLECRGPLRSVKKLSWRGAVQGRPTSKQEGK